MNHPLAPLPKQEISGQPAMPNRRGDRWNHGAWIFRGGTLHALETLLDEAFRIAGTGIRFGLDGIIGLVPGLGDVVAGLLSLVIPVAGWERGVPHVTLVRMQVNLGIGILVGSVPCTVMFSTSRGGQIAATLAAATPRAGTTAPYLARLDVS